MSVEKITFRLLPRDMCRPEDGTFQTHYEARVDRPLAGIDLNEVFQDIGKSLLQPGDAVTFCAFEGSMLDADRCLREIRTCRIVAKTMEGGRVKVKAAWVGELWKVPEASLGTPKAEKTVKLEIREEFEGDFTVRDTAGNVLERLKTRPEAEAYIASYGEKRKPGRPPSKESKAA